MAASVPENTCVSWEDFLSVHKPQLQSIGLPQTLWKRLYQKLYLSATCDNKGVFEFRKDNLQDKKRLSLQAKRNLDKFGDVFLVDHIWTSDGCKEAKEQLAKSPRLLSRVRDLMCLEDESTKKTEADFLDNVQILMDLGKADENRAKALLESDSNEVINALVHADMEDYTPKEMKKAAKQLLTFDEFKLGFLSEVGEERKDLLSDEYIKKMYTRYRKDKEHEEDDFLGKGVTAHYSWNEEDDGSINVLVSVPPGSKKNQIVNKITMKKWVFGLKGSANKVIDGEFHDGIASDECFWTFDSPGVIQMTLEKADQDSRLWPVLIKNEKQLDDKQIYERARRREDEEHFQVDEALENMWFYNQTYEAFYPESGSKKRVWYIMDKTGSAFVHSSEPNFKCAPFANAVTGKFYSVIWPITDIKQGEICTRNFCPPLNAIETSFHREARLLGCSGELPEHCPSSFYIEEISEFPDVAKPDELKVKTCNLSDGNTEPAFPNMKVGKKFYTDVESGYSKEALASLGCETVSSPQEADAFWVSSVAAISTPRPDQQLNRLFGEEHLLSLNLLSKRLRKCCGKVPWFPTTFNLRTQLALLCADHYQKKVGRYWIIRTADHLKMPFTPTVTSNLQRVIRMAEPESLVASYFFPSTLLYKKRHVCLQYAVAVSSLNPLQLLVHNTPNVRLATNEFDTKSLEIDEYDASALITVRQDSNKDDHHVTFEEFLHDVEDVYLKKAQKSWDNTKQAIYHCIANMFNAVSPSLSSSGTCAVYGVDVLIKADLSPLIVGVDALPTFPNKEAATEMMFFTFATEADKSGFSASRHMTRITVSG